ncbi:MAG: hypothetical protein M1829_002674 [Trizodia sp. TS-e1964]|nr:MAG: hypothetical protein M1829_002674 [Trizodia sp. TS-e1964]
MSSLSPTIAFFLLLVCQAGAIPSIFPKHGDQGQTRQPASSNARDLTPIIKTTCDYGILEITSATFEHQGCLSPEAVLTTDLDCAIFFIETLVQDPMRSKRRIAVLNTSTKKYCSLNKNGYFECLDGKVPLDSGLDLDPTGLLVASSGLAFWMPVPGYNNKLLNTLQGRSFIYCLDMDKQQPL